MTTLTTSNKNPEPPPLEALQHLLELAQRQAVDRVQLGVLDLKLDALHAMRSAVWRAAGITALLLGWVLLLGACTVALGQHVEPWTSLACVGGSQCLLGAVLFHTGNRVARPVHNPTPAPPGHAAHKTTVTP